MGLVQLCPTIPEPEDDIVGRHRSAIVQDFCNLYHYANRTV